MTEEISKSSNITHSQKFNEPRKIKMKYDKIRHLELVKRFLDFKNVGKNIHDLYLEKENKYLELSKYQYMVSDYIFWTRRKEFVSSIDFEHFEIAFSRLWWESMKEDKALQVDLKGLKNFELDPKSDGFGSFVTSVFRQFEVLENEECTEQDVKDYVRDTLEEIQPYL